MRCPLICACAALLLLAASPAVADEPTAPSVDLKALVRTALTYDAAGNAQAAKVAYEKIVAADPEHRLARRALGFVKVDGRWLTKAVAKKELTVVRQSGVAKPAAPKTTAPVASRTIEALDDTTRAQRAGPRLYSMNARTRVAAAKELGKIGSLLAAHYLVSRWELVSGHAPQAYFSTLQQQSYLQDFDTEVA